MIIGESNRLSQQIGEYLFPLTAEFDYFQILNKQQQAMPASNVASE